jgi:hypothetical protein
VVELVARDASAEDKAQYLAATASGEPKLHAAFGTVDCWATYLCWKTFIDVEVCVPRGQPAILRSCWRLSTAAKRHQRAAASDGFRQGTFKDWIESTSVRAEPSQRDADATRYPFHVCARASRGTKYFWYFKISQNSLQHASASCAPFSMKPVP